MRLLTKRVTSLSLYLASGASGNFLACAFLITYNIDRLGPGFKILLFTFCCSSLFLFLRTVFGTAFLPVFHAGCIEASANNMVTNTRQVFYTTTSYQHDRVFLKIMSFTRDISNNFYLIGQTHFRYFTKRRV